MKQEIKEVTEKLADTRETYVRKDDFSEFKEELWKRLEDLKETVTHAGR